MLCICLDSFYVHPRTVGWLVRGLCCVSCTALFYIGKVYVLFVSLPRLPLLQMSISAIDWSREPFFFFPVCVCTCLLSCLLRLPQKVDTHSGIISNLIQVLFCLLCCCLVPCRHLRVCVRARLIVLAVQRLDWEHACLDSWACSAVFTDSCLVSCSCLPVYTTWPATAVSPQHLWNWMIHWRKQTTCRWKKCCDYREGLNFSTPVVVRYDYLWQSLGACLGSVLMSS